MFLDKTPIDFSILIDFLYSSSGGLGIGDINKLNKLFNFAIEFC